MIYGFEAVYSFAIDVVCMLALISANAGYKPQYANKRSKALLCFVLPAIVLMTLAHFLLHSFMYYIGILILTSVVFSIVILNKGLSCKVVTFLVFYTCLTHIHMVTFDISIFLTVRQLHVNEGLHLVISKTILLLVTIFMLRFPLKSESKLSNVYWILILSTVGIIPFISSTNENAIQEITLSYLLVKVSLLLASICIYCLFSIIVREHDNRVKYQLISQSLSIQSDSWKSVEIIYNKLAMLNHDIRNHLTAIAALLENDNYHELKKYFAKVMDDVHNNHFFQTGNQVLDAILDTKASYCQKNDINMEVKVIIPKSLPILDYELCGIMCNLIDNAIEASSKEPDSEIHVDIKTVKNFLGISVSNKTSYDVLKRNPDLTSTKTDKTKHGIGLAIVKEIADKYDGSLYFSQEDNYFSATVMLKIEN